MALTSPTTAPAISGSTSKLNDDANVGSYRWPYFELRTSGAFNMYSNLAVSAQGSNHLLVPRSLSVRDQRLFEVVSPEDESGGLSFYQERNLAFPESNLVAWANDNPDTLAVVRELGAQDPIRVASLAQERGALANFAHRLLLRRAVSLNEPQACLRWGPAN